MIAQQGDVILKQTNNDGEITVQDGVVLMDGGITTMAYLCLFGGNEDDDGSQNNPNQYWGNRDETDLNRQYRSELQYLSTRLPLVSGNLQRISDAAKRDLRPMVDSGAVRSFDVESSITGLNRLQIIVNVITIDNANFQATFNLQWES